MKTLFTEEQQNRQPWIWLIMLPGLLGSFIYFGIGINKQIIGGEEFGNKPMSDTGLIIVAVFTTLVMVGLTLLFYKMKMITEIRENGIYFRYPPLIRKFKVIHIDEIESYAIRDFKPIKEYGGHGVKTGTRKFGKSYTVYGNTGLQLVLKNGQKILLGTQRKEALRSAMVKMMAGGPTTT